MASNSTTSVYISRINTAFPIAGKDNNSQGFRDNFTNIYQALSYADTDIGTLFKNSVRTINDNDFNNFLIKRASFVNCSELSSDKTSAGQSGNIEINYTDGSYQQFLIDGATNFSFTGWPPTGRLGKIIIFCKPVENGNAFVDFTPIPRCVGASTRFPETLYASVFYQIWTSDGGTNVYITKLGNDNAVITSATDLFISNSITIGNNTLSTGSGKSVFMDNSIIGGHGKIALIPQPISVYITGTNTILGSTGTTVYVDAFNGLRKNAMLKLAATSTTYTVVTAPANKQFLIAPALDDINWLPLNTYTEFTNVVYPDQPTFATFASIANAVNNPIPNNSGKVGPYNTRKGEITASTSSLYIAFIDGDGATPNYFQVSADDTPKHLVQGTNAVTQSTSNNSLLVATTAFVKNAIGYNNAQSSSVPTGVIVMWYGAIASIPIGWALCDGTNGTPDLRDKFVIGATADDQGVAKTYVTAAYTQTGGSKDAIVPYHNHSGATGGIIETGRFNINDPSHAHNFQLPTDSQPGTNTDQATIVASPGSDEYPAGLYGTYGAYTGVSVINTEHSHVINYAGTSGNATNANLPPFYALAYIMKT